MITTSNPGPFPQPTNGSVKPLIVYSINHVTHEVVKWKSPPPPPLHEILEKDTLFIDNPIVVFAIFATVVINLKGHRKSVEFLADPIWKILEWNMLIQNQRKNLLFKN